MALLQIDDDTNQLEILKDLLLTHLEYLEEDAEDGEELAEERKQTEILLERINNLTDL